MKFTHINRKISFEKEKIVSPIMKKMSLQKSNFQIITIGHYSHYHSYIQIQWEDKLSKDEFLEKALLMRDTLCNLEVGLDGFEFTCLGDISYSLLLDIEQINLAREEILDKALIN